MRQALALASLLLLAGGVGGCVTDKGAVDASASRSTAHARDDDDGDKPRQECEHTSEGGEAKTFCY